LAGDIDICWLHENIDALGSACDDSTEIIVVDASAVTFVGSTAVTVIDHFAKQVEPRGGAVFLIGASPMFLKILKICGLESKVMLASALEPPNSVDVRAAHDSVLVSHTEQRPQVG